MVPAPTHEGLNAVAHHRTSSASTNEDEISCTRAAFEVELRQRFVARLGPSEGDESEEEYSSVDPGNGMRIRRRTPGSTPWCGMRAKRTTGLRLHGGWVLMDTSTMVAEPVALRMGVERLQVLMPTQVGLLDFCDTGRKVQYKLDAQSLRLFGHHRR